MKKKKKNNRISLISVFVITAVAVSLVTGMYGWTTTPPTDTRQADKDLQPLEGMVEVPAIEADDKVMIIRQFAYTSAYHKEYKIPQWVAWKLTAERVKGRLKRGEEYLPNPQIPEKYQSVHSDYSGSKYDRGHMVPSGDMKWDEQAMTEAFYMSNMCPQASNLNRGDWRLLEERCRVWAEQVGDLYIVCGPIVEEGKWHRRIGKNKVTVPDGFFKVVMTLADNRPRAIGFIFPNDDCHAPMDEYAVSVDSVEARTGLDFFAALPDEVEEKIEKMYQFDKRHISQ